MLTAHPARWHAEPARATRETLWLDLLNPTNDEKAGVESKFGFPLPSREELSEIDPSSRISEEDGVLFRSMPIFSPAGAIDEPPSPIGFVLSKEVLITTRYTQLRSFDTVAAKFSKSNAAESSVETFAAIVDEMVDLSADLLEGIAAELDVVSRSSSLRPASANAILRDPTLLCITP